MAVTQGYGKTVTSGLVFAYDVADTRNSYRGEPTTNLNPYTLSDSGTDGSGQGTVGTRTILSSNHVSINDVNANTRQTHLISGLTGGATYTVSIEFKKISGTPTFRFQLQNYLNGAFNSTIKFTDTAEIGIEDKEGWQLASWTFTLGAGMNGLRIWYQDGADYTTYTHAFELRNPQLEQKSHATPYTPPGTTRSSTQGLLPLVGNSTIDLSNVSFDSNAQMIFDGTDDRILLSNFTNKPTSFITCEAVIKPTRPSVGTGTIRGGAISSTNSMYLGIIDSTDGGNTFSMHWANQTNSSRVYNWNGQIPNNQYSHLVGTYDGATARAYLNGVEIWSTSQSGTIPDADYYIGTYGGSIVDGTHNFNGEIPVAKIYNRALSAGEVRQNYLHYKTRFNLS